jgi:hypothetical protein
MRSVSKWWQKQPNRFYQSQAFCWIWCPQTFTAEDVLEDTVETLEQVSLLHNHIVNMTLQMSWANVRPFVSYSSSRTRWNWVAKLHRRKNLMVLGNITTTTLSGTAFKANSWQMDIRFGYSAVGTDPRNVDTLEQGPSCSGWTRPCPTASSRIGGSHPWGVP